MIQEEMAIADAPKRGVDLAAIGQRAFTVVEAPHAHQRTDGDVEGALAFGAVAQTVGDAARTAPRDTVTGRPPPRD